MLQKCRCRQNVVRVIRGVVEKKFVHHGEQVGPRQSPPHRALIRRHRSGIRVVDKQRFHGGPPPPHIPPPRNLVFFFTPNPDLLSPRRQRQSQGRHIPHARGSAQGGIQRQVESFQLPLVPRESARSRKRPPAASMLPRPGERG